MSALPPAPPYAESHCGDCHEPLAFCGCAIAKDEFTGIPEPTSIPASVQTFLEEEVAAEKPPVPDTSLDAAVSKEDDGFSFVEPPAKPKKTRVKKATPVEETAAAAEEPKSAVVKLPYKSNDRLEEGKWVLDGYLRPDAYKNDYVSVSRLKTYEECARQFFFHYVVHAPSLPPSPNAPNVLGSVLHEVLELTYKWIVNEEYTGIVKPEIQQRFLAQAWTNFEDAKRGVLTGMEHYLYCERAIAAYFLGRDVDHFKVVGIEREFNEVIGGVKVKGFIDRVERENDTAIVIDYKNGFMLFSQDELRNDLQATIYDIVVRKIYPWVKETRIEFHMLRHHGTAQLTWRMPEHREAANRYLPLVTAMSESDPTYAPRISKYCGYCDFRTICSLYQRMTNEHDERSTIDETSASEVAKQYHRTTNIAKSANDRRKRLQDLLIDHLKKVPGEAIEIDGYVIRIREDSMGTLPVGRTMRLLKEAGVTDVAIERGLSITKEGVEFSLASIEKDGKRAMVKADIFAQEEKRSKAPFLQISKGKL